MCWMVRFMSVVQLPQGCYGARLHADDSEDQVQLHPGCHGSLQLLISLNFVKYLLPVRLPTVPLSRFSWQSLWESMIFFYDWFFISGLCGMCEEAIVGRGRCKTSSVEQHWLQHFQGLQLYSHFNPLADGIALNTWFFEYFNFIWMIDRVSYNEIFQTWRQPGGGQMTDRQRLSDTGGRTCRANWAFPLERVQLGRQRSMLGREGVEGLKPAHNWLAYSGRCQQSPFDNSWIMILVLKTLLQAGAIISKVPW